jgi:two-component system, OmpR family, sensor kinase
VTQDERPATAAQNRLSTVSLRLRVTAAVMIVLAVMLIMLSIAVNAIFIAQSNRNLDALLAGQAQLARQLARSGAGPQQIVNRVQAGGVQAHLVLRMAQASRSRSTRRLSQTRGVRCAEY